METTLHRIILGDPTLRYVWLYSNVGTHEQRLGIVRALTTASNSVRIFGVNYPKGQTVPPEMEDAITAFIRTSATLRAVSLVGGGFTDTMYYKVAAALRLNTSIYILNMAGNTVTNQAAIVNAFIAALVINPRRPSNSYWTLFTPYPGTDYGIIRQAARDRRAAKQPQV